jgi:ribosomal RNA-processing protein 1
LRFLRAFWITIGREYHALDRYRLDKYLFLIRCYVGVAFEVFVKSKLATTNPPASKRADHHDRDEPLEGTDKKRRRREEIEITTSLTSDLQDERPDGQTGVPNFLEVEDTGNKDSLNLSTWFDLQSYISMLEEGPLCPTNFDPTSNPIKEVESNSIALTKDDLMPMPRGPDGLRYHIMDIWLDELAKILELESPETIRETEKDPSPTLKSQNKNKNLPIELRLHPFATLRKQSPMKTVRQRAGEVLDDDRLVLWGFQEAKRQVDERDEESAEDEEWSGFDD